MIDDPQKTDRLMNMLKIVAADTGSDYAMSWKIIGRAIIGYSNSREM